jgi:histidinol-phosphate aminotransferase
MRARETSLSFNINNVAPANAQLDRLVPDHIRKFEAYVPSKPDSELMALFGCRRLFRLNNNENPLGPPQAAQEILKKFPPPRASLYPSGDAYHMRYRLAEKFGLHPDQFLFGNGANEAIAFVIKAFCQEGDNILTAEKTFAVYEWVAEFSGFRARLIPLKDFGFNEDGMIRQIDERTKIAFICNPNNPTGTYWNKDRLIRFLQAVAGRLIVVVDEAYFEFVETEDYPNSMELLSTYPNLVLFRTFSKMYGLAGLRIGYLAGSLEAVSIIRRTCIVYSVNTLAQEAALACLDDDDHILQTRELVRREKGYLVAEAARLGIEVQAREGCYVMMKLPMSDTLAYRKLMSRGVMIRSMTGFRFPNWIRVSIGGHEAMEAFVEGLHFLLRGGRRE